ncbi:hypothetical protein OFDDKENP_00165 [Aeromonas phage B614]|nr:hypothetical protein OFDDKENP_00165 [Aeromonas phage B614]UYD58107.1 hypothetical protein JNEOFJEA_00010 [Aeromonas phage UP87]UYD58471.1 hypothetical protein IPAKJDPM_00128 [Aeromonas phage avDM14-QBC]UYD58687.1 hypothetical protein HNNIDBEH_00094 [Aeromonas phage avDM10-HWA]UYD59010.1 hypothetical protein OFOPOMKI_00160 [Aeromonas phage avDM7-IJDJ]UYD59822.1 hypothetical protein LEHPIFIF_00049 [Aeromonas phage avDM9-HANS]
MKLLHEEISEALVRVCRINIRFMGDEETANEIADEVHPIIDAIKNKTATRKELGRLCHLGLVHEANLYGADWGKIVSRMEHRMKKGI